MPIDVEVRLVPVHPLAHPIPHPPDGKDVTSSVKCQRIGLVQPLAGQNLVFDWVKTRIVSLK